MTTAIGNETLSGHSFGSAVRTFFRKYAMFRGRATRSEYWWSMLFALLSLWGSFLVMFATGVFGIITARPDSTGSSEGVVDEATGVVFIVVYGLFLLWTAAIIIPSIAVTVRRLHDAGFSGWLWWVQLVPGVGSAALFVLTLLPSVASDNQWGPAPTPRTRG